MESVFLTILKMSIDASWLILGVLLFRYLFTISSKVFRMFLWGLIGLKLLFPISLRSIFSIVPDTSSITTTISESGIPISYSLTREIKDTMLSNYVDTSNIASPAFSISFILSVIWIIGVVFLLFYILYSYIHLSNKTKVSIKGKNNIFYCDYIASPFILGLIEPKIYIPSGIDPKYKEFIITHENRHIQHKDYLWKPIGYLLLSLHCFNPLVWISYYCFCKDIEFICDERVVKEMTKEEKKSYSKALLECGQQKYNFMICPVAFNETGLKERVQSILHYQKPTLWISIITVVCCLVIGCTLFTSKEKPISILAPERNYIDIDTCFKDEENKIAFDKNMYMTILKGTKTSEYQDKIPFINYKLLAIETRVSDKIQYTLKQKENPTVYYFYCIGYYSEYVLQEDGFSIVNTYEVTFPFCLETSDDNVFTYSKALDFENFAIPTYPYDRLEEKTEYINTVFPEELREIALQELKTNKVSEYAQPYNTKYEYTTLLYNNDGKPMAVIGKD